MAFVIENIRLKELKAIVDENHDFYIEFIRFIEEQGYRHIRDFVKEPDESKSLTVIRGFLSAEQKSILYDGIFRPFANQKARWYFLSWLFRDAPAQRLNPLVASFPGENLVDRRAALLNRLRKDAACLFPSEANWEWPALSEVLLSRLEGSRRALKGTLFEGIVRRILVDIFEREKLGVQVGISEKRIESETYDVQAAGSKQTILLPVKTRETMGGGHALLFTRDIHKSISVAVNNGYSCIPIIIAESWGGNLSDLASEYFIYIQRNPNELKEIEPLLRTALEDLIHQFRDIE